jgi:hypothetical protein
MAQDTGLRLGSDKGWWYLFRFAQLAEDMRWKDYWPDPGKAPGSVDSGLLQGPGQDKRPTL